MELHDNYSPPAASYSPSTSNNRPAGATTSAPPAQQPASTTTTITKKKYIAMIAPVKIMNCPSIQFGKKYFCRVTRLKDQIEYATSIVKCETPGHLDFSKFRRSDNRGAQRPPFITPINLQFESQKDKRTVTIYVEEYSEVYRHHNSFLHIASGAVAPLHSADADTENRVIAATGTFDLIDFVNVFEDEAKGLVNFPISVKPSSKAAEETTLMMCGRRSVCEVDILMHPSSMQEPMWPSVKEKEQNFYSLISTNNNKSANNSMMNSDRTGGSSSSSRATNANSSSRRQRTASARHRLAVAENAIYRANLQEERKGRKEKEKQQQQQEKGKQQQQTPGLTPEIQRQMQNALASLNQIQNLRNTANQLENEILELEERQMEKMNSSSFASPPSRGERLSSSENISEATSPSGNNDRNNENDDDDADEKNDDKPKSTKEQKQSSPSSQLKLSDIPKMEESILRLELETQMMVDDAMSRWATIGSSSHMNAEKDESDNNPSSIENKISNLLSSQNFIPTLFQAPHPHGALDRFVTKSNTLINSTKEDEDDKIAGEKTKKSTKTEMKKEMMIQTATSMCSEMVNTYLKSVIESGGDTMPNFSLPTDDEIAQELLKRGCIKNI